MTIIHSAQSETFSQSLSTSQFRGRLILLLILQLFALSASAQHTVVADAWTRQPIAHASLYAKEGGHFRSAITDASGHAHVSFAFRSLTVSHLNYAKLVLRQLPDTVFMEPQYHLAAEVTVSSEPAWIRPMLRRFVKQKAQTYYNQSLAMGYNYTTQSIAGTTFYRYQSEGWLRLRHDGDSRYHVAQFRGTISAPDTTHLTDMTNMRRMLYEDFVSELDAAFIRQHKFSLSDRFETSDPNLVELIFRSRSRTDDRGSFVIDTARCIVLSAMRTMGTRTNKSLRVSPIMLTFARAMSGYNITTWDVDYAVSYTQTQGCWHPDSVRYKFFFQAREAVTDPDEAEFDKQTGGGFSNMESTITLFPAATPPPTDTQWMVLPPAWYIKLNTETEREQERQLAKMPAQVAISFEP